MMDPQGRVLRCIHTFCAQHQRKHVFWRLSSFVNYGIFYAFSSLKELDQWYRNIIRLDVTKFCVAQRNSCTPTMERAGVLVA